MAKYIFTRPNGPWQYPTLGFTADVDDVIEADAAPDLWWEETDSGATVTLPPVPALPGVVEPTDGAIGIWNRQTNTVDFVTEVPDELLPARLAEEALANTIGSIVAAAAPVAVDTVVVKGDSLAQGQTTGGTYYDWSDVVASELGVDAVNLGYAGRASTDLAAYYGALDLELTVTGGTIAASGATTVAMVTSGSFRTSSGASTVMPGYAVTNTGVRFNATLTHVQGGSHYWTITPSGLSAPITAASITFHCTVSDDYRGAVSVLVMGTNNWFDGLDPWDIVRDTDLIVRYEEERGGRVIVLGSPNVSNETRTSADYATRTAVNAALSERLGSRFVDLRAYLIKYGLTHGGLGATADDTTDMNNDTVPRQLRIGTNDAHYTSTGYDVIAKLSARTIASLSYIAGAVPNVPKLWPVDVLSHTPAVMVPGAVGAMARIARDNSGNGRDLLAGSGTDGYVFKIDETQGRRILRSGALGCVMETAAWTPAALTNLTMVFVGSWSAAPATTQRLIGLGGTNGTVYTVGLTSAGYLTVWTGNSPGLTTASAPTLSARHVVVVTVAGTTATIYVDGTSVASGTVGALASPVAGKTNFYAPVGVVVEQEDSGFLSRALSAAEVTSLSRSLAV